MSRFKEIQRTTGIRVLVPVLAIIISITAPLASARAEQAKMLVPMGSAMGIQIHTDGVMVVGLSATENGSAPSPSAIAGLLPGDLITALGGEKVGNADDFRKAAEKLDGSPVSVTVERGGQTLQFTLEPRMGSGSPELGLWLRDSISGIGTLTYYDPETGRYGGLGHSINDVDTGMIMPLGGGRILRSTITGVAKGNPGAPGELYGSTDTNIICGSIELNTSSGIFGILSDCKPEDGEAIPMGTEGEISLGKATILANVTESVVEEFEIEIVRVYRNDPTNRSMMIKVTDAGLIERTGGIVQGMSGSPIIQNGKLIGAVTHVLINDPTSGFAVSIERMLESSSAAT